MTHIKNIFLYTEYFPFGKGEAFLEHELPVWEEEQIALNIIALKSDYDKRSIGTYHKVEDTKGLNDMSDYHISKLPFKLIWVSVIALLSELIHRKGKGVNIKITLSTLLREAYLGTLLLDRFPEIVSYKNYSYWCDHWMLRLSLLRRAGIIKHLMCRVHGFDLYSERHRRGYIPFQRFMLKSANKVFAISEQGCNYLKLKFNLNNLFVSRLGVPVCEKHSTMEANEIHILTCFNDSPVKRSFLLFRIMEALKVEVTWTHFGDNIIENNKNLFIEGLPQHIVFNHKAFSNLSVLHNFYRSNNIDVLLNVSSSEGIPVSMMEAMSFGVPVIGPDVGGVPEIVNNENGWLVSTDEDKLVEQVCEIINDINFKNQIRNKRTKAIETSEKYFNNKINIKGLIKELISL